MKMALALVGLALLSCSHTPTSPHTPESRYGSSLPYQLVYVEGQVYLRFTVGDSPAFGPFVRSENGDFRYEEPPGYFHSVSRSGESWYYSHSYVHMASELVDAAEILD
jgi:hypothetical protein